MSPCSLSEPPLSGARVAAPIWEKGARTSNTLLIWFIVLWFAYLYFNCFLLGARTSNSIWQAASFATERRPRSARKRFQRRSCFRSLLRLSFHISIIPMYVYVYTYIYIWEKSLWASRLCSRERCLHHVGQTGSKSVGLDIT